MGESESGISNHRVIPVGHTSTFLTVARDALIILALAVLGGDIVGLAVGASANVMRARIAVIAAIVLCGIVGFFISGYRTPRKRWVHLRRVTACVWLFVCGVLLSTAYVDVAQPGIPIGACVLCGVFLLVAMGIGGALSLAMRKDPGDNPMRAGSDQPSTRTPLKWTSEGDRANWIKVAAVLSSTLFFLGSCTGITWVSIPVTKHIGGKYMARGDAPDRDMEVIVSIPDPAVPGQRKINAVMLGSLPEFQREHPDLSFLIPALSGEIDRNGASISYRATALGADDVRVETDTRFDTLFGPGVLGSYEASEREVRPIYTHDTAVLENMMLGCAGACILSLTGSTMQWVQRRRQQRRQPSE